MCMCMCMCAQRYRHAYKFVYTENVEATVFGLSPVFDALYLCNSEAHNAI